MAFQLIQFENFVLENRQLIVRNGVLTLKKQDKVTKTVFSA